MQEFYNLRMHIEFVQRQTRERRRTILATTTAATTDWRKRLGPYFSSAVSSRCTAGL